MLHANCMNKNCYEVVATLYCHTGGWIQSYDRPFVVCIFILYFELIWPLAFVLLKYLTYAPEIIELHRCVCDKNICFNIKIPSNQYRNSHYKDATIVRPSHLYNENLYTWKSVLILKQGSYVSQSYPVVGGRSVITREAINTGMIEMWPCWTDQSLPSMCGTHLVQLQGK